jgi:putative transposase
MENTNDFRTGRHCGFTLHAHLVFVTKYRRGVLTDAAHETLRTIFAKVCQNFEAVMVDAYGEDDYVHLLVEYPPKVALSTLVNSLKGVSSRRLRQQLPDIAARCYKGVVWSPIYFAASCGGAPLSIIQQYIEDQRKNM